MEMSYEPTFRLILTDTRDSVKDTDPKAAERSVSVVVSTFFYFAKRIKLAVANVSMEVRRAFHLAENPFGRQ